MLLVAVPRSTIESRATAPIEASASPRKPSVAIVARSSPASFEVQWRATASARSSRRMPAPSSVTRIRLLPPPAVTISIRRAPASSAFSTSSFTTLAGRSTTSPAAMRLMTWSGRRRIVTGGLARMRIPRNSHAKTTEWQRPLVATAGNRRREEPALLRTVLDFRIRPAPCRRARDSSTGGSVR